MTMARMPLHPLHNQTSCIDGDVSIDPSATIAPGVMLIANPQSRIVIGAGVCIGMGVILHAHQGTIEVQERAILGAGVLIVGLGTIGAGACIGSVSTVLNASVKSEEAIAPGSLLGDLSRTTQDISQEKEVPQSNRSDKSQPLTEDRPIESTTTLPKVVPDLEIPESTPSATQSSIHSAIARNLIANPPRTNPSEPTPTSTEDAKPDDAPQSTHSSVVSKPDDAPQTNNNSSVSGHQHLQRLMSTLFPHRQSFDSQVQDTPIANNEDEN